MFTGIIEELGAISYLQQNGDGARLAISAATVVAGAKEGDSIAVNGVCLTALDITLHSFAADVSGETLRRTTLGRLRPGARVNLERAVTPTTRLGGHIVQGHVDAVGRFMSVTEQAGSWTVRISFPPEIARYFVFKGSVAVEGMSLTIAALADDYFEIAVIPQTWRQTNLSTLRPSDEVNLEADIIAKYVERLMTHRATAGPGLTLEKLVALGYVNHE
jgi:riboflavin synthase